MSAFPSLEKSLDDLFVKQAPALPAGGKKALVSWLPWINLILGVFTLWSVYWLWHWAHIANRFVDLANSISAAYGGSAVTSNRLGFGVWLGIAVLAVQAVLYLLAFPATRDRKKSGWDLLFYALLVNIVYGVVSAFTSYGGFGHLLGALIGSAIGLYLLFQIRSSYQKAPAASKPA